ncbi:MFS transporter [Pseudopedobacter sp.]|uniref:MFS transporter n=1 Tax=Pseudopedobacter sp. TaxID=1936787 RepID=UPI00334098F0
MSERKHIRAACSIFFFISGFGYASWASRIPTIQQQLNLNEAQLGTVLFAMPVGLILTLPLTKYLLRKHSSNLIMLIGALLFNITLCLPGFTNSILQLMVVLFVFGAARNIMNISMNGQSVAVQAHYTRSIITTFHGVWSMAGFAGAGLGYLMVANNIGTEYHLPMAGILMVLLSLAAYPQTLYQEPIPEERKPVFSLPDKSVLGFAIICFACMATENVMYDWAIIYFEKAGMAPPSTAITGFVVYMIFMTMGRFGGDKIVHKIGIVNIIKFSGLMIFFGLLLVALFPYKSVIFPSFALVGLGVSCIVPLIFSLAGRDKTVNSGTRVASISTIGYLGFLVVPPSVGYLAHATSLRWAFGILSFLGLMIFILTLNIKNRD